MYTIVRFGTYTMARAGAAIGSVIGVAVAFRGWSGGMVVLFGPAVGPTILVALYAVVQYAVAGGLLGAAAALIYNHTVAIWGGLEITVEPPLDRERHRRVHGRPGSGDVG